MEAVDNIVPGLLAVAVLLPLASFWVILLSGKALSKAHASNLAAYIAAGAIVSGFILSAISAVLWFSNLPVAGGHHDQAAHAGDHPEGEHAEDHGHQDEDPGHHHEGDGDHEEENGHHSEDSDGDEGHAEEAGHPADSGHSGEEGDHGHGGHHPAVPSHVSTGVWYTLAEFGPMNLNIGYYVDSLTVIMFCMVTLIASCIHFYAMGYMHEELHDVTDHEVTLSDGEHLHRPGRYHRFFQYLSLFCFSMLGLVIAGNVAMTFVFWELVGICSYFLIGFYVERKSASTAANKAFIVNRVGDFGFIIGLMALWSSLGTFNFGDITTVAEDGTEVTTAGIFSQVRPEHALGDDHAHEGHGHGASGSYQLIVPPGMLRSGGSQELGNLAAEKFEAGASSEEIKQAFDDQVHEWEHVEAEKQALRNEIIAQRVIPEGGDAEVIAHAEEELAALEAEESPAHSRAYWLLIVAGVGIFCGCVGKSAQFPLHTWLPDAMEGPTPVSALVHSATMVAAGVFLVGRFYPVFLPEVLLVIAIAGTITLFMAATIAITATDIKRVLAYSTVSQLGYMMLALGLGGWLAGLLHLITHAFFKSLLFMCSGSVIHAVHSNEMTDMGGLVKKMPITAWTMFIGCLAIAGAGIPFALPLLGWVGFSGFYSKDAILEQAFWYGHVNQGWKWIFFVAAAGGAAITAFYMFRMWFMTFTGEPRDQDRYDHAHESPRVMTMPLIICATFAVAVAWPMFGLSSAVESARHAGTLESMMGSSIAVIIPDEHGSHAMWIKGPVTWLAFATAICGIGMAAVMYWKKYLDPAEVRAQFASLYSFLLNKWWFDELYDIIFVRPTHVISRMISGIDTRWIDRAIDGLASCVVQFSRLWDFAIDRSGVDGLVNLVAKWTFSIGSSLREVQTGRLRQYVMFIVIGTVAIFVLLSFFWNAVMAG